MSNDERDFVSPDALRRAGFESVAGAVDGRPSAPLAELSGVLGVPPHYIAMAYLREADDEADLRRKVKELLYRRIREAATRPGAERRTEDQAFMAVVYPVVVLSAYLEELFGVNQATQSITHALHQCAARAREMGVPAEWQPESPDDALLSDLLGDLL